MVHKNKINNDMQSFFDEMHEFAFTDGMLSRIREIMFDVFRDQECDNLDGIEKIEYIVPGSPNAPSIRALLYRPVDRTDPLPAILHIHGGGFILGNAEMTESTDVAYVQRMGVAVVSLDYRLAPETPHPGPVEDCYAVLGWMFREATALGIDPFRIAVSGESAGGALAAALAILARDRAEIPICFLHLLYPMLDDRSALRDDHPIHLGHFIWSQKVTQFAWKSLLGPMHKSSNISPYASPARATDLSGLPPTFIVGLALDLFISENIEFAQRLIRAGVPTELHVHWGASHAFNKIPDEELSETIHQEAIAALSKALSE